MGSPLSSRSMLGLLDAMVGSLGDGRGTWTQTDKQANKQTFRLVGLATSIGLGRI